MGGRAPADWERSPAPGAAPALGVRVLTFAPAASCGRPQRATAPSSSHGRAPHSAAHSWPERTNAAPRRRGRGGTAGRADSPGPLPPPGPRGGWAGRCSQDALHHSPLRRGAAPAPGSPSRSHPVPWARVCRVPGAGFLRTRLLILGLLVSTPKLDTGKGRWGRSQGRRQTGQDNYVFQWLCLQCIFIPKHTLALQVFAPLGSVNRRQALPGDTKRPAVRMCLTLCC